MTAAPRAVAVAASSMPIVWSDQPTGTPNARRIVSIAPRLASSIAAG